MRRAQVVDSSGWLEYFADGPNAQTFAAPIESVQFLVVPVITVYEVFRQMYVRRGELEALRSVAQMRLGQVVDIDDEMALAAVRLGLAHGLAMADSLILATARHFDAVLWTQDADFGGLHGVEFIPRA